MTQLRGRAQCPNTIAEQNGTAEANKRSGVKCTHWVDKNKTECRGSHSLEDHEADLAKFRTKRDKGKGKGKSKGKGGGKGKKGKGKDKIGELTEDNPGMTEAEFECWLHGDGSGEFTGEGYWCLVEPDTQCVDCSEWAVLCRENGAYIGATPKESMATLADAVICQSCRRQPGQYQCAYCVQVIRSLCA